MINYISNTDFKSLIGALISKNDTSWIASCGGEYDLICTFFASNPSQFNKKLKEFISRFPKIIHTYEILTTAVIREHERDYLLPTNSISKEIILGGDREPESLDEYDMEILNTVSENARITSVEIAKKINLTPKTVISSIKNLEKK